MATVAKMAKIPPTMKHTNATIPAITAATITIAIKAVIAEDGINSTSRSLNSIIFIFSKKHQANIGPPIIAIEAHAIYIPFAHASAASKSSPKFSF